MAPKAKQTLARGGEASPELNSGPAKPLTNCKTGRPIRKNAGQKKGEEGYVNSAIIELDDAPSDSPSEDEDGLLVRQTRSRKRKRSPSPPPPPLEPIPCDESADEQSDEEQLTSKFRRTEPEDDIIKLQFNIPLGFHGPLVVKLDRSLLNSSDPTPVDMHPLQVRSEPEPTELSTLPSSGKTLKDLPAEIRNRIYRELFVADSTLKLNHPHNFRRSAQFLACCRMVHSEGCSILYGENTFSFGRNKTLRGRPYETGDKEVGYKDVRRFLQDIGPENLVYLRDIEFSFEDAQPSAAREASHEERRYFHDAHLMACLRVLRGAKLRNVVLAFQGRRQVQRTDDRFLDSLERIKADHVSPKMFEKWYGTNKIQPDVFSDLKDCMTRKKKLYPETK